MKREMHYEEPSKQPLASSPDESDEKLTVSSYIHTLFKLYILRNTLTTGTQLSDRTYRVYQLAHFKYGIYKPREVEHPIKKRVRLRTSFFIRCSTSRGKGLNLPLRQRFEHHSRL